LLVGECNHAARHFARGSARKSRKYRRLLEVIENQKCRARYF
jgi:hypothetical protein